MPTTFRHDTCLRLGLALSVVAVPLFCTPGLTSNHDHSSHWAFASVDPHRSYVTPGASAMQQADGLPALIAHATSAVGVLPNRPQIAGSQAVVTALPAPPERRSQFTLAQESPPPRL